MQKDREKKELIIIGFAIVVFITVAYLSFSSMYQLRGNARVINYAGIVRGATQKLVKEELHGVQDDALISRLDGIVMELRTGVGPNDLSVLDDRAYLDLMGQVEESWTDLKREIGNVRDGADNMQLFDLSQEYFALVDKTVTAAEDFSEAQVNRSQTLLIGIYGIVMVLILGAGIVIVRSRSIRKKADALNKIAYIDALTQIPNRASCEQEMNSLTQESPEEEISVFMFDMNNLKRVNDELGHQGGDRIIADFARIIRREGEKAGFVGRYGGDEFIAILQNSSEEVVEDYLRNINEKAVAYNLLRVNEVEKISFAVGYVTASLRTRKIDDLINEADKKMYVRKRQMKENKI